MTRRVFDGEIAHEIAGDDDERYERLRAVARGLIDVVRDGLLRDGEVRVHGFGTFRLQHAPARTGRNPRTGEPVEIPARNRVLFRPAKALRERIEPHRAATVLAEPQPSREASLAPRGPVRPVPATSATPHRPSAEPTSTRGDGARPSREASLGNEVPKVSRAVATVPAVPPRADRQPVYAHAVSTGPTAEGGASREATLASGAGREKGAGVLPGDEKEDWVVEGEADMPRHRMARVAADDGPLNEAETGTGGPSGQAGGRGPESDDRDRERRRGGFWVALVLVLLLLGVAIWLLWPNSQPGPRVAEQDGTPAAEEAAGADQASTQEANSADAAGASGDQAAAGGDSAQSQADGSATADASGATQEGETAEATETAPANETDETAQTTETAEASGAGATGEGSAATDAETGAGEGEAPADGGGSAETADASSGESAQRAAGADAAAASAGGGAGGDEAGGDTGLASAAESGSSSAAVSSADGGGDAAGAADEAAATGSQAGKAGGGDTGATSQERPLHGMAAAGSTRTPRTGASAQQASAGEAGNGTMPTSAEDIEDAGAKPASDAGAGEGSASGEVFFQGREYTVQPGDTLWGLAERNYVNPFFWPHIWNNNDDLANPDRISVDQLLWLPTLEGEPTNLTEADRRSIAQGYLQLYRFFKETGDANPGYALVGVRFFDPSVLPERLRGSAAVKPSTALAATFKARLESRFETR